MYLLAAAIATGPAIEEVMTTIPDTIFVKLRTPEGSEALMYSAIWSKAFCDALLNAMARRRRFRGQAGELIGSHTREFRAVWGPNHPRLEPVVQRVEQSNNSIIFGDRFIMKIFRRIEPGLNPDIEVGDYLTKHGFPTVAKLYTSEDQKEGARAFAEKRAPRWKGR